MHSSYGIPIMVSVYAIMKIVVWRSLYTRVEMGLNGNVRGERL